MIVREERIGPHRLIQADCMDVLPGLGKVDAVVTDAPFGISDSPIKGQGRTCKRKGGEADWFKPSDWDVSLNEGWGIVCDVSPIVVWFGQWRKRENVASFMKWRLRAEIVWAKDCHVGPPCPVAARDERIWVFSENGIKPATFETSVWDQAIIPTWERKHHKNQKPVALMCRLLRWVGAQTILDPFMGSGTTGVACVKENRTFIGIELDHDYFDIACRRVDEAMREPRLDLPEPVKPVQQGFEL